MDFESDVDKNSSIGNSFIALIGYFLLLAYIIICSVACLGTVQLRRKYGFVLPSISAQLHESAEGVSVIRPLKGIDPHFEDCIKCIFEQDYPKFEILFCVQSRSDPAVPIVERLIRENSNIPAKILFNEEFDCGLNNNDNDSIINMNNNNRNGKGEIRRKYNTVNPKINNVALGYDEAKYDILWVLDSNAWMSVGALGRSVDGICQRGIELVHHLPLCVDVSGDVGSLLDEMFMSTSHAKFYQAINTVGIAPCVMGKSNLYRKSMISKVTQNGISDFGKYIAEDQMIADAIWKAGGRSFLTKDIVRQPVEGTGLNSYFYRRVRWLIVRKHIVVAATLVEPFTECFLCGIVGLLAISFLKIDIGLGISKKFFFILHVLLWCMSDYFQFKFLHSAHNVEINNMTPAFARNRFANKDSISRISLRAPFHVNTRSNINFKTWILFWLLRESLAFIIWAKAILGTTVIWRGRKFRILSDLSTVEIYD